MEKYTIAILTDDEGNRSVYYTSGHVNKAHFGYYALGYHAKVQVTENPTLVDGDVQFCDMTDQHTVKVTHAFYHEDTCPSGTGI